MFPKRFELQRNTIRERTLPNEQDNKEKWFSSMLHERLMDLRDNESETHNQFKMETISKRAGLDYDRYKKHEQTYQKKRLYYRYLRCCGL